MVLAMGIGGVAPRQQDLFGGADLGAGRGA